MTKKKGKGQRAKGNHGLGEREKGKGERKKLFFLYPLPFTLFPS
jgi:hypothetical protein